MPNETEPYDDLQLRLDPELDAAVERLVPQPYRGPRNLSKRVDYALRDWVRWVKPANVEKKGLAT